MNNILTRKAFSANANKLTVDGSDTCDSAFIAQAQVMMVGSILFLMFTKFMGLKIYIIRR